MIEFFNKFVNGNKFFLRKEVNFVFIVSLMVWFYNGGFFNDVIWLCYDLICVK